MQKSWSVYEAFTNICVAAIVFYNKIIFHRTMVDETCNIVCVFSQALRHFLNKYIDIAFN